MSFLSPDLLLVSKLKIASFVLASGPGLASSFLLLFVSIGVILYHGLLTGIRNTLFFVDLGLVLSCFVLSEQPGLSILLSYGVSLFPPRLINQRYYGFMSSYDVYSNVLMRFCNY